MADEKELRIKATADTAAAKAQVDALNQSIKGTATAEEQAGASALKGEAGLAALQAEMKATVAEAGALAAGETAAAGAATGLGAAVAGAVPQIALIVVAIELFSKVGAVVKGIIGEIADKVRLWALGLSDLKPLLAEHGKALDPLSDKYQKAADAAAKLERNAYALAQGLVVVTDNASKNVAALELARGAIHGWSLETAEAQKALAEFGLKAPPTFDQVRQAAEAFGNGYQRALKDGTASARTFAELNKGALEKIEVDFLNLGKTVPPELKKVSDSTGLFPKVTGDAEDAIKKLTKTTGDLADKQKDIQKALTESGKSFEEHTRKVEADRQKSIEAVDATTQKTIADLQKQVKETEDAHAARTISDDTYWTKINTLIAEEAKAKRDAYDKEGQINTEAAKSQAEASEKFKAETIKRKDALVDLEAAQDAATKKLNELNVAQDAQVRALQTGTPLLGAAAASTKVLSDQFGITTSEATVLSGAIDSVIGKMRELAAASRDAAQAVASVTE